MQRMMRTSEMPCLEYDVMAHRAVNPVSSIAAHHGRFSWTRQNRARRGVGDREKAFWFSTLRFSLAGWMDGMDGLHG